MSKIKAYLAAGILGFIAFLGLLLRSKNGQIKELELRMRKEQMEKDLEAARAAVKEHHDAVEAKEQAARDAELNYRHAVRLYNASKENGESK